MERVIAAKGLSVQLVIATLGLSYVLKGAVRQTGLGDSPRWLPSLGPSDAIVICQFVVTLLDLVILLVGVAVMVCLYVMFRYTRVGKAMRAVGMNPRASQIVGINLVRIRVVVWALAGLISAIVALLITPKILITPDIGHIADRQSVLEGQSVSVRVDLGGRRIINKNNKNKK